MKKIKSLFAILAFGGLLLSGCDLFKKGDTPAEEPKGDGGNPEDTVLVDNTYESINLFGNNKVVVNGEDVNNDWAVKEFNGMTAISLTQAKAIDEGLYATLKTKSIKGLYKFEGLVLGTNDAGWEAAKMVDGVKEAVNGSYAFKACGCDKNEDEEWIKTCHFPSAEAHGESLTPATCFVTSNMAEDPVDGFDHNSNPVALEAGVYTAILATYKTAVGAMGITCGVGLKKTGDREAFVPSEDHSIQSMDVAGTFTDWADHPLAMTKQSDDSFELEITVTATDEFKVRVNGQWTYSLGASALENKVMVDNDTNIKMPAGTYLVHVKMGEAAMADITADQTILAFTITAAVA